MNNGLDHLGDILFVVCKNMKKITESTLKEYGLGTGQLQLLFMFYSQKHAAFTQKEIVNALKIDKGNISRSLSKLLDKGYITKDETNGRLYMLTSSGIELKDELIVFFKEVHNLMTAGISSEQLLMTIDCLLKMNKNLEAGNES